MTYYIDPETNILQLIDSLVNRYLSVQYQPLPDTILLSPGTHERLNREVERMDRYASGRTYHGANIQTLMTQVGPIHIRVTSTLEFPIFIGSQKEYEDNCFSASLEKILDE